MQVSKEKICKCGHEKTKHDKSLWSGRIDCQFCNCSDYMNRILPNKFSLFSLGLGIFVIGFTIITGVIISIPDPNMVNKTVNMKISDLLLITDLVFVMVSLMVFTSLIMPYFQEKKRKNRDLK